MQATQLFILGSLLFSLTGLAESTPALGIQMLEDYDMHSLQDNLDDHPMVAELRSDVLKTLDSKNDSVASTAIVASDADDEVVQAVSDIEILMQLLQIDLQYTEIRQRGDPAWPTALASKVRTGSATKWDEIMFMEDIRHVVSSIVIMRILEERVSTINKFAGEQLENGNLFSGSENETVEMAKGFVEMQFLELFLHTINEMLSEVLNGSDPFQDPISQTLENPIDIFLPITPTPTRINEDDDAATIFAMILLFLSLVGFMFIIFLVGFSCFNIVKKCFAATTSLKKKSKYEQI